MNNRKKSLLIAMCIGDGHVFKSPYSKSCGIAIKHSIKQEEYIKHKHKLIISLLGGHKPKLSYINQGKDNKYPAISFGKTHRLFRVLRKQLYKNKKKVISRKLLDCLTPEGIAIWYMDDGGLAAHKRNGRINSYSLFLNTHITKKENEIIINYFQEVWNITFRCNKNKGSYRLRCGTQEAKKFIEIVKPFIINSMYYKINM